MKGVDAHDEANHKGVNDPIQDILKDITNNGKRAFVGVEKGSKKMKIIFY